MLTFRSTPDFENPRDGAVDNNNADPTFPVADNVYRVIVVIQAGDGDNRTKTYQPVEVTVTNVDEPGSLRLSTAHPKVVVEITATLTDPDGKIDVSLVDTDLTEVTGVVDGENVDTEWRWATSTADTGPWNDIAGCC